MDNVVDEINKLQLDNLSDDWIQAVYYSEFMEYGDLPDEYQSILETIDIPALFRKIMKSIGAWLYSETDNDDKSWTNLSTKFEYKSFLTLLAYYIHIGSKHTLMIESRNNALLASRLYFKLLSIPGYKAYHIYHSQLFAHSLACLTYPKIMCDSEENYFNTKELVREVNTVIGKLGLFAIDLKSIITGLQLSPNDMNFEDILSNLVEITGGAIVNKLNIDKIEFARLTHIIYEIIDILLCDPNGAPKVKAIQLLFKCMLPKLIAASVDSKNANNIVRASYVAYTGLLLSKYGKAALPGYIVLLQHLCYTQDGLERAEVRTARVSLVFGLMSLLPRKSYRDIIKWLLKLTTTAKVIHRQIAMEVLAKLLTNDADIAKPCPVESTASATEVIDNQDPNEGSNDQSENQNTDNLMPKENTISTDDESSQELPNTNENEEMTEDDLTGLLSQRAHTTPHGEVIRAMYERLQDVSSTLRARALAILTECIDSQHPPMKQAIQELEGVGEVSRLVAAGARCVCDERAVVRRAAAALLQRLLATRAAVRAPDTPMLVGLCRDASIVVRTAAISALGELLIKKPCDELIDAFLTGPMHQLSDPEVKIQEQVTNLIQQILLERFQKYDEHREEDPLPWMFLAGIVRHNMRKHLQKACTLLVKSSNHINHRLVDLASTHLGAAGKERDLQCLVLLTCVATHVFYSDIKFVVDCYYKLEDDPEERDGRTAAMALELLHAWAQCAPPPARADLRARLLRRLAAADHDGCRIACASLAAQLDPDNIDWATELMQISARRALAGGEVEEWVRAADLSLVADAPPDPALLRLFLAALATPPPEWCGVRLATCVAGVGRLCVRARSAAAAAAPPLARLLQDAAAPLPARLNALLALADVATRYSCIVEPLLPALSGCVRGGCAAALRRAAARALTRLLLAGFLRLRAPLYYRYCALLADEDHDVREPAEYYVTCCLTVDAIYHHFVDCIVYYNKEADDDTEKLSFDARQLIYDVMLQRLSAVQRLNVQCRLARELLQRAADLDDEPPPDLHAALLDAITLLCGPRMKLPKKPEKTSETADIDDLQERITTNIVSHKMKRTVAELLVPAVLQLYGKMRAHGGQLVTYLVRIATDLLSDYRQEIEELIENDEELVERVQQFQETIGLEPSFGNSRNLVTASAPPEPDTPRAPRKRPRAAHTPAHAHSPRKRKLRI